MYKDFIKRLYAFKKAYLENDEQSVMRILKQCVAAYPDFEVVTYAALKSKKISWKCSLELGDIFFLLCDYAYSKKEEEKRFFDISLSCYAWAFLKCPFRERHKVALSVSEFIFKSFYDAKIGNTSNTIYTSYAVEPIRWRSDDLDISQFNEYCNNILFDIHGPKLSFLLLWHLYEHLIKYNELRPNEIPLNEERARGTLDKLVPYFLNESKEDFGNTDAKLLKRFANSIWKWVLFRCSDEELDSIGTDIDDYCREGEYKFDTGSNKIYFQYIDVYDDIGYIDKEYSNPYNRWNEDYEENRRYAGFYAQDAMGYSDDEIDTIFDGDPEAYWNID